MAEITASLVKELREETGVGMMECKNALVEAGGDKARAVTLLRERGMAIAGKKASRAANQGLVASWVSPDRAEGVLIEVNCETDFVAKNETFKAFVAELVDKAKGLDGELAEAAKDLVTAKVAEIGENIVVRRNARFVREGNGLILDYIHLGGKVGVLLELGCEKPETADQPACQELARDITLHIAACKPDCLTRDQVPAETVDAERAIYAKQVENKPANIVDKIVDGKMNKFYQGICLVEQAFVKDPAVSITDLLAQKGQALGDTLSIRRYVRFQIGA